MKVYSLFKSDPYEKELLKLANSSKDREQMGEQYSKDKNSSEKRKDPDVKEVAEELLSLNSDESVKETGLIASFLEDGPGLTVLFKDRDGNTVRKISGNEFLQMREESKGKRSGKLLDRKM